MKQRLKTYVGVETAAMDAVKVISALTRRLNITALLTRTSSAELNMTSELDV